MKTKKAFTMIELLVVISIIGFLATLALISYNNSREEAKEEKCRADLKQILKAIEVKRDEKNTFLRYVTGSACSNCSCSGGYDSSSCISRMTTTFTRLGFPGMLLDPWGDPYLIDENEDEPVGACRRDSLYSPNCGSIYVPFFSCK